ncbi:formylglycine-generating enzyme family protein [Halovulum sp. GXIMD14793]
MKKAVILILVCVGVSAASFAGWSEFKNHRALTELAERTRKDLIFVQGGTFEAGNYEVRIRKLDGSVGPRWVREPSLARPPKTTTFNSFYISADEASAEAHQLFISAQDLYPPLNNYTEEDGSASMSWAEARDYCAWLGDLTGIALRLPTEDEWEYAARSRGAKIAFATDDGEYRLGVNVQDNDRDTPMKPLRSFPPNPLGLRDLVEGSYEWVSDPASTDPEGIRIAKGGSSRSTSFLETIPNRYVVDPLSEEQVRLLDINPRIQPLAALGPVHIVQGTARCVADVSTPPSAAGFGREGGGFDTVPTEFGPYDHTYVLVEDE